MFLGDCLNVFSLFGFVFFPSGKPELRTEVDILVADVAEADSLAAMCRQAVIVLNCVGPVSKSFLHVCLPFAYRLYFLS